MEQLSLSIENQLLMMEQYRLTAEESLMIELLFMAQPEEGHKESLVKYLGLPITKTGLRDILLSLQAKGIITKAYKVPDVGQTFDPESVIFNKNFLSNYRKYSGDLGAELWEAYPEIGIINGKEVRMKNFAKRFNTFEEFFYRYGKNIGWKLEKHKEVIELINWAKQNKSNLLNVNIADFVITKAWEGIKKFKEGTYEEMVFDTLTEL